LVIERSSQLHERPFVLERQHGRAGGVVEVDERRDAAAVA
jgi:hypothetical protein